MKLRCIRTPMMLVAVSIILPAHLLALGVPVAARPHGRNQEAKDPPHEATVSELVEQISRKARIHVIVPRDLAEKRVSGELSAAGVAGLYQIGDLAQAHVFKIGERTYVLEPSLGILNCEFLNVDYRIMLDLAARGTGANIVVTSSPLSSIMVQMTNGSLRDLLQELSNQNEDMVVSQRRGIYHVSTGQIEKFAARNPLGDETLAALGLGRSHRELKKSVSFALKGAKPSDALKVVSETVGFSIELDERLDEEAIDLTLVDAPWRDAIEAIAWSCGGALWDNGKGDVSVGRIPRITMDGVDTGIWNVLEQIGKDSGVPIDYGYDLEQSRTLDVRNVPWRDLLYVIWRNGPFQLTVNPDGGLRARPHVDPH